MKIRKNLDSYKRDIWGINGNGELVKFENLYDFLSRSVSFYARAPEAVNFMGKMAPEVGKNFKSGIFYYNEVNDEFEDLEEKISNVENKILEYEKHNRVLEEEISQLEEEISENDKTIQSLEEKSEELNSLRNRLFNLFKHGN